MQAFPARAIFSAGGSHYRQTSTPLSLHHTQCRASNASLKPLAEVEALKRVDWFRRFGAATVRHGVIIQATGKQIVWNRSGYLFHLPHCLFLDTCFIFPDDKGIRLILTFIGSFGYVNITVSQTNANKRMI